MEFIKKNYEKVLLSIVLLGLAVAAALLPMKVGQAREFLDQTVSGVVRTKPKEFQSLELSTNQAMLARFVKPAEIELSGVHNLFNPVPWKERGDGTRFPVRTGTDYGPGALVVTNIKELNLEISFEGVVGTPESRRYKFSVIRETDSRARSVSRIAAIGDKNDLFTLVSASPVENPEVLTLRLRDENESITVQKDQPYKRVMGYAADLVYPKEKQSFEDVRAKQTIRLAQDPETYKIVVIDPKEVVLSASSGKRFTIRRHAVP